MEQGMQLDLEAACPVCGSSDLLRLDAKRETRCTFCKARFRDADKVALVAPAPGPSALRRLGTGGRPGVRRRSLIGEGAGARAFQALGRELRR